MKLSAFDQPIIFLIAMFLGIVALFALTRALFTALGWTGPLGLVTMGIGNSPNSGVTP